ncbi:MAG: hypothetical protein M3065_15445, partial [Actinomycetota bacterium]|nr:hypothetical protein [Actinomycetota bacterium]
LAEFASGDSIETLSPQLGTWRLKIASLRSPSQRRTIALSPAIGHPTRPLLWRRCTAPLAVPLPRADPTDA